MVLDGTCNRFFINTYILFYKRKDCSYLSLCYFKFTYDKYLYRMVSRCNFDVWIDPNMYWFYFRMYLALRSAVHI